MGEWKILPPTEQWGRNSVRGYRNHSDTLSQVQNDHSPIKSLHFFAQPTNDGNPRGIELNIISKY